MKRIQTLGPAASAALAAGAVILLAFSAPRAAAQSSAPAEARFITVKTPAGASMRLLGSADNDNDGISNALEVGGYYFDRSTFTLQPCDVAQDDPCYVTDPLQKSTDADPYTDYMEVSGINRPGWVNPPYSHPHVAARPVVAVHMLSYDVILDQTITDARGGSVSTSYENTTSNETQTGGSWTVEGELSKTPSIGGSYSENWSETVVRTVSTKRTEQIDWNTATTFNTAEAARLKLRVRIVNEGGAAAENVRLRFTMKIGEKEILTFTTTEQVNSLAPGESSSTLVIDAITDDRGAASPITLTLEELKAIESGAPLALRVDEVVGGIPEVEDGNGATVCTGACSIESSRDNVEAVTTTLIVSFGGEEEDRYEFQVFSGTTDFDPGYTLRDLLARVLTVEDRGGLTYVKHPANPSDERVFPDDWYLWSPSRALIASWEAEGEPENMLGVPMKRGTRLFLLSPSSSEGASVDLATFSLDLRQVRVAAWPSQGFPILKAKARVVLEGVEHTLPLSRRPSDAFFTNEHPFDLPLAAWGEVTVTDARGAVTTHAIESPIPIVPDCATLKGRMEELPPGEGREYVVFAGGDARRPADAYCRFRDAEGVELASPKTFFWMDRALGPLADLDIYGIDALNPDTMVALAGNDVWRTSDGGRSWVQATFEDTYYRAVAFDDAGIAGVVVGDRGVVAYTTDTGMTWKKLTSPTGAHLYGLTYAGEGIWYAAGPIPATVLRITRDGNTFTATSMPVPSNAKTPTDIAFKDENTGMLIDRSGTDQRGRIYFTRDGARTWELAAGFTGVSAVSYAGADTWITVGQNPGKTADMVRLVDRPGGWDVAAMRLGVAWQLTNVAFAENGVGFATGGYGAIWRTDDYGASWQKQEVPLKETWLRAIDVLSPNWAVAAGFRGGILVTTSGGGTPVAAPVGIEEAPGDAGTPLPDPLILSQNYPNPFRTRTTIAFRMDRAQDARLVVYDLLGREVAILADGPQPAGVVHVDFDASRLASGTYFYRLRAGTQITSRMMTVTR